MEPQWLLGEVADEIDKLNGRPDSTGRCLLALDRYLQSRSEEDRAALSAAYEAIPEHLRLYALGDMDSKDWPLRVLVAGVGGHVETYYEPGHELVTGEMRLQALDISLTGSGSALSGNSAPTPTALNVRPRRLCT